jgi:hypothetical protein
MGWYEDLEYDISQREPDLTKAHDYGGHIYVAIGDTVGEPSQSALIYAVDVMLGDEVQEGLAFLLVDNDRSYLIEFKPPARNERFLSRLAERRWLP